MDRLFKIKNFNVFDGEQTDTFYVDVAKIVSIREATNNYCQVSMINGDIYYIHDNQFYSLLECWTEYLNWEAENCTKGK